MPKRDALIAATEAIADALETAFVGWTDDRGINEEPHNVPAALDRVAASLDFLGEAIKGAAETIAEALAERRRRD